MYPKISNRRCKQLIVLCSCLLCNVTLGAQTIIAHRGASARAPENTLAAVKLGFALGADAVEIDIHRSADNKLMVIHDHTSERTTGVNYTVSGTKARNLRKLDAGSWKGEQFKGERIPFLKEVIRAVPREKTLVIELKTGPEVLPFLEKDIRKYGKGKNLVLISFYERTIVAAKAVFPDIPAYWLIGNLSTHTPETLIALAKKNNLDGLNMNYRLISAAIAEKVHHSGLKLLAYTVNDPEEAKKLKLLKVDAITTDIPETILMQLK
ncbi:glycerophosphodiester phosphodiesterase [Sinomicrobium oceani]|uniref:glycerophosphodiester phosphodiesterase n=1 Tax=Sinomicrobium oceani TaxID=1150368 RepID=UPI00227AA767|nr:glycerophosphodiester phosphodiesterase family protein [Sinomicrobium oceani]